MAIVEDIDIGCSDDVQLKGSFYLPKQTKAAVIIAPATGIKRNFYHRFASYLCENDFAVVTFDNRGIGDSATDNLNGCNASLVNWGKLDMPAALKALQQRCPDSNYHLVGHSAGGQLVGLMHNANELKSMVNFGSSSGSLKYAKYPFKIKSYFWLNIFIPLSNLLFKKTQSQWLQMGEPLPIEVSKEWRRWCNGKGYVAVDLNHTIEKHGYDDLSLASLWVHAADDDIANDETVKDMIRVFTKMNSAEIIKIEPEAFDYTDLGHMKFFSKKRARLWPIALQWLEQQI